VPTDVSKASSWTANRASTPVAWSVSEASLRVARGAPPPALGSTSCCEMPRGMVAWSVSEASLRVARGAPPPALGFTLLELLIALALLGLISALLYGSLSLSAHSWDRGEQKVEQATDMRLTEEMLRQTLAAQHPLRFHKVVDQPLYFAGGTDSLSFAAAMPGRAGGGMFYFRVAIAPAGERSRLTLARVIPDYGANALPDFSNAESSVLAEDIAEVRFGYFGRDPDSTDASDPTWRDRWDDSQILPLLIRIDVRPVKSQAWPTMIVEPRLAPEAGCRTWYPVRNRCIGS
jgi:general secretion pathway protein J